MKRHLQPELMDDPDLDADEHRRALDGLGRVHRLSFTASHVWSRIRDMAAGGERLRVVDVACGGGDLTVDLWWRARNAGTPIRITGIDVSPLAVRRARELAEARGASVRFEVGDALRDDLPEDPDVVLSSLFLHHLDRQEAVQMLERLAAAARRRLVMDDLRRSAAGWLLAAVGTRLLSRSPVVQLDGPRSVRAAFTPREARVLAREAGLRDVAVMRHWPFRYSLVGAPA